jgi:hypothetical protein
MSRVAWTGLLFVGLVAAAGCGDPSHGGPPLIPTIVHVPMATITIVPSSARVGSPGVTITITGKDFANSGEHDLTTWATWEGSNGSGAYLSTHFVDSSHLTADIPADLLRQPVSATISVTTACSQCDTAANRGSTTFVVAR